MIRKRLLYIAIGFLLLLLPVIIVSQIERQQQTRSRAAGEQVTFSFAPLSQITAVSNTFTISVFLDAKTNNITGLDMTLLYNSSVVDAVSFQAAGNFNTELINTINTTNGTVRFAAVNTATTQITGNVPIGTLTLKAKAIGIGSLSLQTAQVTAEGVSTALPLGNTTPASYTVASAATATPTPVPLTITGTVFNDTNNNGIFESGEPGFQGAVIKYSGPGSISGSVTSNTTGNYSIPNPVSGNYILVLDSTSVSGRTVTTPGSYSVSVQIPPSAVHDYGLRVNPTPTQSEPTPTSTPTPIPPTPTRTPTPTQVWQPTATPTPIVVTPTGLSNTTFHLSMKLQGIGSGGDSANPTAIYNENPLHPSVPVFVYLINTATNTETVHNGTISYNPTLKYFKGTLTLSQQPPSGIYLIKVKSAKYLRRLIDGVYSIAPGTTFTLPVTTLIVGDATSDNKLNILDYNIFLGCYSVLLPPTSCTTAQKDSADFNDDGKVDQVDYNLLLRSFTNQEGD